MSIDRTWIPMTDGARLAVTLYLPAGGSGAPSPCLLEALPYRKDDLTASYRPEYVRFQEEYGYAVARVDLRGSGSSTGIALDEYHPQEQADLHEVIAWLAGQPWCSGAVGMFGTSWSGFNSLQLACERPPALKAVVASYATDDRWSDDVHYMGGALRLLDLIDYPLYMVAMNGLPPVPAVMSRPDTPLQWTTTQWKREWARRARSTPPWLIRWLEEHSDGPYWRHGSLRASPGSAGAGQPSYERIACPTLIIAGWADGYRNNTFRTFRGLTAAGTPVHVLAGPWSHMSPMTSVPGPHVDHVAVMARWWDRWLRALPNGVEDEPPLRLFVRAYSPPEPDAPSWAGRWEAHDARSLDAVRDVVLPLTGATMRGGIAQTQPGSGLGARVVTYAPALDVGVAAWNSCAASLPWGQPADQSADDARSLTFEWPMSAGTVVLGHPRVRLRVRPDAAIAFVSAKLSLVAEGGRPSLLVDRGLLNLAYRDGNGTAPRPCTPEEWIDVEVELEAAAFEVTPGITVRLALACADWPNTVAPPGVWSAVDLAASALVLPVSAGTPHPPPVLELPVVTPPAPADVSVDGESSHVRWLHGTDVLARTTFAEVDHGSTYGSGFGARCVEHYTGRVELDARSGAQRAVAMSRFEITWPEAVVTSEARLVVQADSETFDVRLDLDVEHVGHGPVVTHRWHHTMPRAFG